MIQEKSKQLLEKQETESSFQKRNNWIIGDKIRKIFFRKPWASSLIPSEAIDLVRDGQLVEAPRRSMFPVVQDEDLK